MSSDAHVKVTTTLAGDAIQRLGSMASLAFGDLGPRIADAAQTAAPVLTGELVQSIGFVEGEEGGLPVLYIAAGLNGLAPYAGFVELGTSNMAAQPYLAPSVFRKWL